MCIKFLSFGQCFGFIVEDWVAVVCASSPKRARFTLSERAQPKDVRGNSEDTGLDVPEVNGSRETALLS
jgi:hypothetical protein